MGMTNRKAATPYRAALEAEKAALTAVTACRPGNMARRQMLVKAWLQAKSETARKRFEQKG